MATNRINIGMGEGAVAGAPHVLVSLGVGSCVVVTLYDSERALGGMAHVMLPDADDLPAGSISYQCADTAIHALLTDLLQQGAAPERLRAKMAGGARMFSSYTHHSTGMGAKNIRSIKEILIQKQIPLAGWDIAGHHGRSVEFYLSSGQMVVKGHGVADRSF